MNQYEAMLAAQAHFEGRAVRNSAYSHRRLLPDPLVVVAWQLGGEPFSASAIGYGSAESEFDLLVAGDARNRDLAFAILLEFARWFIPRFEVPAEDRMDVERYGRPVEISRSIPQVVVPSQGGVAFLGRLGRRLAYLPTDGPQPAPFELVRLGQHLQFVARHADEPGQQLVVPLSKLVADNWVTPQTTVERASLPALDAWIEPLAGRSGYEAALEAETLSVGPSPSGDEDEDLERLVDAFNRSRANRSDPAVVAPLLGPIETHYNALVEPVWQLVWKALHRERQYPEASSVSRRWDVDREQYTRHIDWVAQSGRRRTRQTARQAIGTMKRLEEGQARLEAEEALDDSLRMIPYLLDGKAVEGQVVSENPTYKEVAKVRMVNRPLVTIRTDADRPLPRGKSLYWTQDPGGPKWEVHEVQPSPLCGYLITLKLTTGGKHPRPQVGDTACFSVHGFDQWFRKPMAPKPPWPLVPAEPTPTPAPIESAEVA